MKFTFESNLPIYKQLVEQLKLGIATSHYKAGEKLPSVREFSFETKVNPNTVQRALQELEDQNYILTQRTSGKFVTDNQNIIDHLKQEMAEEAVHKFMISMKNLGLTKEEIIQLIEQKRKEK